MTLYIVAIPMRKSPDLTVCTNAPAVGAARPDVGAGVVAPAGTTNLSPGRIRLCFVRLFSARRSVSAIPTFAAIPARKSPSFTMYTPGVAVAVPPAADVVAGAVRLLSVMAEKEAASSAR